MRKRQPASITEAVAGAVARSIILTASFGLATVVLRIFAGPLGLTYVR